MTGTLATAPVQRRRVLIVDDNQDAAESMALLLNVTGHEAHVAFDGRMAIKAIQSCRPEVVRMDIGLPGMDGYEVARQVRSDHTLDAMLLVALTGYCQAEDRDRSLQAGFNVHLVKPAALEDLEHVLSLHPHSVASWPEKPRPRCFPAWPSARGSLRTPSHWPPALGWLTDS